MYHRFGPLLASDGFRRHQVAPGGLIQVEIQVQIQIQIQIQISQIAVRYRILIVVKKEDHTIESTTGAHGAAGLFVPDGQKVRPLSHFRHETLKNLLGEWPMTFGWGFDFASFSGGRGGRFHFILYIFFYTCECLNRKFLHLLSSNGLGGWGKYPPIFFSYPSPPR